MVSTGNFSGESCDFKEEILAVLLVIWLIELTNSSVRSLHVINTAFLGGGGGNGPLHCKLWLLPLSNKYLLLFSGPNEYGSQMLFTRHTTVKYWNRG